MSTALALRNGNQVHEARGIRADDAIVPVGGTRLFKMPDFSGYIRSYTLDSKPVRQLTKFIKSADYKTVAMGLSILTNMRYSAVFLVMGLAAKYFIRRTSLKIGPVSIKLQDIPMLKIGLGLVALTNLQNTVIFLLAGLAAKHIVYPAFFGQEENADTN